MPLNFFLSPLFSLSSIFLPSLLSLFPSVHLSFLERQKGREGGREVRWEGGRKEERQAGRKLNKIWQDLFSLIGYYFSSSHLQISELMVFVDASIFSLFVHSATHDNLACKSISSEKWFHCSCQRSQWNRSLSCLTRLLSSNLPRQPLFPVTPHLFLFSPTSSSLKWLFSSSMCYRLILGLIFPLTPVATFVPIN